MSRTRGFSTFGVILVAFLLTILSAVGWYLLNGRDDSAYTEYREFPVTRGRIDVTVTTPGVVEPENRLEIKPPVPGRIDEVLVDEGDAVTRGQILAWISSTERAALIDAARARGPEEVKRWESFYKATPVIAPINGTIILRSVEPGQTFTSQDAVLVMSDRLTVKAQVDETDLGQIRIGQRAEVTLDAYPDKTIPADVLQIAYDAKTVNNVTTYQVDVLPGELPDFMRSGMTANVSFSVASRTDVLLLPVETVRISEGRSLVLLRVQDSRQPVEREVRTGLSDGKNIELLSGLNEGDVVVVEQVKSGATQGTNPFAPFPPRQKKRAQ